MGEMQEVIEQQSENTVPNPVEKTSPTQPTKIHRVLYLILGIIEVLLGFRFVLLLLGANIEAGFAQFVGNLTNPLMAPFKGLFPVNTAESGSIFSPSIIVAMIVYALVFYVLAQVVRIITEKQAK